MKIAGIVVALLLVVAPLSAQRVWKVGVWRTAETPRTYVIDCEDSRYELEDAAAGATPLEIAVNEPLTMAIEKDTLFVRLTARTERALRVRRTSDISYTATGGGHYVKSVSSTGDLLTLEDNSVWEIEPRSHFAVMHWEALAGIAVRRAQPEDGYNYEVINLDHDDGVSARHRPK